MSDFQSKSTYQQSPYARPSQAQQQGNAYAMPRQTAPVNQDAYDAFRRPEQQSAPMVENAVYPQESLDDFALMGDDAPTRIAPVAKPVMPVGKAPVKAPAAPIAPVQNQGERRRSRRSRVSESQTPVAYQPEQLANDYSGAQGSQAPMSPVRSQGMPPRCAMPKEAPNAYGEMPYEEASAPQRMPQQRPPRQRPSQRPPMSQDAPPKAQRQPMHPEMNEGYAQERTMAPGGGDYRKTLPQRPTQRPVQNYDNGFENPMPKSAPPMQKPFSHNPNEGAPYAPYANQAEERASYRFEGDVNTPKKGNHFVTILVIVLIVLGALLAAICLPDWDNMGGVGQILSPIKTSIVSVFSNVQSDPIDSFSVSASESTAPATIQFTVQTSKGVNALRIVDDLGVVVYEGSYTAEATSNGEVIENSNILIWKPTYELGAGYTGGFTVFAGFEGGKESEGFHSENNVAVAQPEPSAPAVQDFSASPAQSVAPATVTFMVVTSMDVTQVQIVDEYQIPVATYALTDLDSTIGGTVQVGETREWTLRTSVQIPYDGRYRVMYKTDDESDAFIESDYSTNVSIVASADGLKTGEESIDEMTGDSDFADALQTTQMLEEAQTPSPTSTVAPTQAPTPSPTATPTPTPSPTPSPTPVPEGTPLPALTGTASESADPELIKLKATVLEDGETTSSYTRSESISLLSPYTTAEDNSNYAIWRQAGVLTFRGGPFRQNASYGTANVTDAKLSTLWTNEVGSMAVNKDTVYGVIAPGQPVIVKWPTQIREIMGLTDEAKTTVALKEAIVASQDGNIYFYNLLDGTLTRDPIEIGAPSPGGLSIATNGTPLLGVGQSHRLLANGKSVDNGYRVYNLINNKMEYFLKGNGKDMNSNYSGVFGSALFDSTTGSMVVAGQNGVLYTAELGNQRDTFDYLAGSINLNDAYQGYKTLASKQDKKESKIDASVAMYNNYAYYGDEFGILQCVDINTLQPVWAVNLGDNLDSTPALDMDEDGNVSLYIGTTIYNLRKEGEAIIRRFDALTGEEMWSYTVPDVHYDSSFQMGCYASPIVGQESLSDVVIYNVSCSKDGSRIIALEKETGKVKWEQVIENSSVSSPVAVYNEEGDAWIVQAESNGNIHLMDGKNGAILDTLALDVPITASPAAYGNLVVIGSTGRGSSNVYCIEIQ